MQPKTQTDRQRDRQTETVKTSSSLWL